MITLPEVPAAWNVVFVGLGVSIKTVWDFLAKKAEKNNSDAIAILQSDLADVKRGLADCQASHRKRDDVDIQRNTQILDLTRNLAIATTKIEFLEKVEQARIHNGERDALIAKGVVEVARKSPNILDLQGE